MSFFPELLYQLSARDQQVSWLDPIVRTVSSSALSVTINARLQVPIGQVLLLQSAVSQLTPGAAQSILNNAITIIDPTISIAIALAVDLVAGPANVAKGLNWSGSIIVPPQWFIASTGSFSAAAVANVGQIDAVGLLIPVGNVQRV